MMDLARTSYGVLDNRFLARSVGLLNPPLPVSIREEQPIRKALELLKSHKVGCLLVVTREDKLVGVFSERDVVLKVSLSGLDVETTPISQVMTKNPQTAQMTATIAYALSMMSHGGYRHIPLVDDDLIPLGLISVKDIIDYIMQSVSNDLAKT